MESVTKLVEQVEHRADSDNGSGTKSTRGWPAVLEVFDLLGIGWGLCDGAAQLLAANRTAEEILSRRDGLELNSHGVVCTTRGCGRPLNEVVQQATTAGVDQKSESHDIALIVRHATGKGSLTVWVHPVTAFSRRSDIGASAALLLIVDSALPVKATHAELYELYGLTPTETRLANLLMDGKALEDCCRELAVSLSTVRGHLKRMFRKTGVHHQGQLVSLLVKSIGLACMGMTGQKVNENGEWHLSISAWR